MTWLELRLPARATTPRTPARRRTIVHARLALFLAAWAFITLHWLSWQAFPFQALIAGAVLWHALSRERVLARQAGMEAQLRDAEERYRGLVETLPLATYVDRSNSITGVAWVSPQIAAITSYTPEEWMADPDLFAKVVHPDDRAFVLSELARSKTSGDPLDYEYRLVRRDGTVVWIHDHAVMIEEGGARFARGFIVDVTARREAELELAQQNEQLRALDRLKDEFVALVSHELRTPLTSIRGYLELMREDGSLSDEHTSFVETIERNALRLQRVVGDLLFFAQVEAGKLTLEEAPLDLNAAVDEAVIAARPAADAKSIELTTETGDLPELTGDHARLTQVLDNLISNAVKFTPAGGNVTVTTRATGDSVEIAVADTGMGIPADELPRLFQRFFRTERATSAAIPGTGLGLAIAKAIVEGHGGRITVESADGAGTTFRISLPR